MPRCVDKIERGPLQYTVAVESGPGDDRPAGEIRHHHAGADRDLGRQRLLSRSGSADSRPQRGDARRAAGTGRRRLRHHPDGGAEHPSGRDPARRRHAAGRRLLRRDLQSHRQGTARPDRGVGHTCWGNPAQQRLFATQPVVPGRAAASQPARRRRADVRVRHQRRDGPRVDRAGRSRTRRSRSVSSTTATCRWSAPNRSRISFAGR